MLEKIFGGADGSKKEIVNEKREIIEGVLYGPFDTDVSAHKILAEKSGQGWQIEENAKGCPHAESGIYVVNRLKLRAGPPGKWTEHYSTPWEACVNCRTA